MVKELKQKKKRKCFDHINTHKQKQELKEHGNREKSTRMIDCNSQKDFNPRGPVGDRGRKVIDELRKKESRIG